MKLRKKGKKSTKNSKEPVCYNYGKIGHFEADCFKKKNDDRARTKDVVNNKKKELYNKKEKRVMAAA